MRVPVRVLTLGFALVVLVLPGAQAQRGGGGRSRPLPGVVATPPPRAPGSQPLVGFGTLGGTRDDRRGHGNPFDGSRDGRGFDGRDGHGFDGRGGDHRFDNRSIFRGFGLGVTGPLLLGPTFVESAPFPPPNVIYYPAPVYYPVYRHYARPEAPAPEAPHDPARSKTLFIGPGVDGGGGVMQIEPLGGDSLRLTWNGSTRAVRSAELFLADSLRQTIGARAVVNGAPSAVFRLTGIADRVAYAGLTVVWENGATATTLVPYPPGAKPQR